MLNHESSQRKKAAQHLLFHTQNRMNSNYRRDFKSDGEKSKGLEIFASNCSGILVMVSRIYANL